MSYEQVFTMIVNVKCLIKMGNTMERYFLCKMLKTLSENRKLKPAKTVLHEILC